MKVKINRRLVNIAIISLIAAGALIAFAYNTMSKAVQPEPKEPVLTFKSNMEKDMVLKSADVETRYMPKSTIPKTALKDPGQVKDKRLLIKAEAGDIVTSGKIIERGDVRVDVKDQWTIGIDVTNISNALGGNLKEGKGYVLLYRYPTGNVVTVSKVKIASLIDSTGKIITDKGEGLVKTVNVSVDQEKTVANIARAKIAGTFEIVDAPEGINITPVDEINVTIEAPQAVKVTAHNN